MQLFTLLSFKHVILYLFPTLVFIIVFGIGLNYTHFRHKDDEERKDKIHARFPEDIEGKRAPFPLFMTIILIGIIAWMLCYILAVGLLGVKI